jgi:hypothetical protein
MKMPERDPIDLIREQLNRMDDLVGLHEDHEAFKQWHLEMKMILEKAFSSKSIHYQSFSALRFREMGAKAFASHEIDKINAARYKKDLENARNILQTAIKELTLDRTLFKKLQTTPKTVDISLHGKYFLSSGISDAGKINAIESALQGSGLSHLYGNETFQKGDPLRQRIEQIREARIGIFDLSAPVKDEVLIELGSALGMGKEIIIIYKTGSLLPEVIKSLNKIEYENLPELTQKLKTRMNFS